MEFFQTVMGKIFYEGTVPRLVKALEKIADHLDTPRVTGIVLPLVHMFRPGKGFTCEASLNEHASIDLRHVTCPICKELERLKMSPECQSTYDTGNLVFQCTRGKHDGHQHEHREETGRLNGEWDDRQKDFKTTSREIEMAIYEKIVENLSSFCLDNEDERREVAKDLGRHLMKFFWRG